MTVAVGLPASGADRVEVGPIGPFAAVGRCAHDGGAAGAELEPPFEPLGDPGARAGSEADPAPGGECLEIGPSRGHLGGRDAERVTELVVRLSDRRADSSGHGQPVGEEARRAYEMPRRIGGERDREGREQRGVHRGGHRRGQRPPCLHAVEGAVRRPGALARDEGLDDVLGGRIR